MTDIITNPAGVNGATPEVPRIVWDCVAGGAILKNDLVAFVMASDGVLTVAQADTDTHDPAVKVGVALEAAAAAGDIVRVVVYGPAIVNTPATGPSVSEVLVLTSTAGVGDGAVADANTVAGDIHGVFLTDEIGTSNTSWVFVTG